MATHLLNEKLEMFKLSEEGMSKAKIDASPVVPVSQIMNAKEKFLKDTKSAIPVNIQMIRKRNSLFLLKKVLEFWMEDQTNRNIFFPDQLQKRIHFF